MAFNAVTVIAARAHVLRRSTLTRGGSAGDGTMDGTMTDAAVIERSDRPRPDAATVAEVPESPWRIELGPPWQRGRPAAGRRVASSRGSRSFVVAACAGFVFYVVHPDLIFREHHPTGGDMGAHVWGPRYLREHLLPAGPGVGLVPRLVRRLPRLPVLHGGPVALRGAARARAVERARVAVPLVLAAARAERVGLGRRPRCTVAASRSRSPGPSPTVVALPIPYNVAFKLVDGQRPGRAADRGVGLRPAVRAARSPARPSWPSRRCSSSTTASRS